MRRTLKLTAGGTCLLLLVGLLWLNACRTPLVVPPLRAASVPPVVDEHLELARRYAPWILKEIHPTRGRQDLPAPVDFDGDLDGENAWDNFPTHELLPTVYYAVLATRTHWFLTYHVYHPRDWTTIDLGVHLTHENDGENLQVVVERGTGRVVLLFTQAHYRGRAYARADAGFRSGEVELRGAPVLVDGEGRPNPQGTHACVLIESGGHGIHGVTELPPAGEEPLGRPFRPARAGEPVIEPQLGAGTERSPVAYRLESTTARLWPLLASGELVGEGRLLDGTVPYADARVRVDVPRYYEADRFSGPFGPDRGISPFAVDFRFSAPHLGALFFDPARRWSEVLAVPEPWDLEYEDYPFIAPDRSRGASGG